MLRNMIANLQDVRRMLVCTLRTGIGVNIYLSLWALVHTIYNDICY